MVSGSLDRMAGEYNYWGKVEHFTVPGVGTISIVPCRALRLGRGDT